LAGKERSYSQVLFLTLNLTVFAANYTQSSVLLIWISHFTKNCKFPDICTDSTLISAPETTVRTEILGKLIAKIVAFMT